MTRPTPWFTLDRFDTPTLHTRTFYAGRFDAVESAIAGFSAAVHDLDGTGDLTTQGFFTRMAPFRDEARKAAQVAFDDVARASAQDHAAIDEILEAPEAPPSVETGLALAYAQALAMRSYEGPMETLDTARPLFAALEDAIEDDDAIVAQVLADLAYALVRPTGQGGIALGEQLQRLTQRATRLRAPAAKRAALKLADLLDGTADEPGVDLRQDTASALLGPRLELIAEDGEDRLVGAFGLDFPLPMNASPRTLYVNVGPQNLRQLYGLLYGIPGQKYGLQRTR